MLDIKRIRENLEDIKKAMEIRGEKEFDLYDLLQLDDACDFLSFINENGL